MEDLVLSRCVQSTERVIHHDDILAGVDGACESDTLTLTSTQRSASTANDCFIPIGDLFQILVQSTGPEDSGVPLGVEV